ncbi:MAG: HipA domain-containing protein [Ignavibacteriaceae bacterium]|nr:HipA domain-containing protein [Ignavibacteriaceae bacterium]
MNRCLYCYGQLYEGDFHSACSKKFFGNEIAPIIPYELNDIYKLGKIEIENRITIPGVQSKLSVDLDNTIKSVPKITIVGFWGNYILKPPSAHYNSLPENEDLTMKLARIFGIKTVQHSLIKFKSGEIAYLTKRIDREKNKKLHMEDFCQLSERLTEDKYKGSMESVAKIIDKYSSNPGLDKLTLFEITLFSFLTGNADMHLKNFSVIYKNNMIYLSPAYDLLSTRLVISEKDDPDESALTINGKKRNFKLNDFLSFAKSSGLDDKQIENTFRLFGKNFGAANKLINQSFLKEALKKLYRNLLNERAEILNLIN